MCGYRFRQIFINPTLDPIDAIISHPLDLVFLYGFPTQNTRQRGSHVTIPSQTPHSHHPTVFTFDPILELIRFYPLLDSLALKVPYHLSFRTADTIVSDCICWPRLLSGRGYNVPSSKLQCASLSFELYARVFFNSISTIVTDVILMYSTKVAFRAFQLPLIRRNLNATLHQYLFVVFTILHTW